jgi:hypothetical protein
MMKHPDFDQMVALAERLRLELDSADRKNLVGSQIARRCYSTVSGTLKLCVVEPD